MPGTCTLCMGARQGDEVAVQCGCACAGAAGWAHLACKVEAAVRQGNYGQSAWNHCELCDEDITGPMRMGLARALMDRMDARASDDFDRLGAMANLASAYYKTEQNFPRAEALYREWLVIGEKKFGPDSSDVLNNFAALGVVLMLQANTTPHKRVEAGKILRDTLARRLRVQGREGVGTLQAQCVLADLLTHSNSDLPPKELMQRHRAEVEEGLALYRSSAEGMARVLGPGDSQTLLNMNNWSTALGRVGRYDKAEPLSRECLALTSRAMGPEHESTLMAAMNLGGVLYYLVRPADAEVILSRAMAAMETTLPEGHSGRRWGTACLAEVTRLLDQPSDLWAPRPARSTSAALLEKQKTAATCGWGEFVTDEVNGKSFTAAFGSDDVLKAFPAETVLLHTLQIGADGQHERWDHQEASVHLDPTPFSEGTFRVAHRALLVIGSQPATQIVVKFGKSASGQHKDAYQQDVGLQAYTATWAASFNDASARKIDVLVPWLIEWVDKGTSAGSVWSAGEPHVSGVYVKHNNNGGYVGRDDTCPGFHRAQAFGHWTWEKSKGDHEWHEHKHSMCLCLPHIRVWHP